MKCSDAALFSDLDGTLFNCRGEVSINNRNAIEDFIAHGGMFGIATGRAVAQEGVGACHLGVLAQGVADGPQHRALAVGPDP